MKGWMLHAVAVLSLAGAGSISCGGPSDSTAGGGGTGGEKSGGGGSGGSTTTTSTSTTSTGGPMCGGVPATDLLDNVDGNLDVTPCTPVGPLPRPGCPPALER